MYWTRIDSPIGPLLLAGERDRLCAIELEGGKKERGPQPEWVASAAPFREAMRQLRAYFARDLKTFDLPLAPNGTPFQQATWRALREIPYGEVISYAELAHRIDRPKAIRAVGAANASNPLPIVIPCHRVIGSNGNLTGYGGGLENKRRLLMLEGYILA